MSDIKDASNIEFVTVVGAAAHAVTLQEEEEDLLNQNKTIDQLMHSTAKFKSEREDSMNKPTDYSYRWFEAKPGRQSGSSRFERGQRQTGRQNPSTTKPAASFSKKENGGKRTTDSTRMETKVDAWERAKMDKIRKRYEKMKYIILEWQNEKKLKAKRRMKRKERDLELRHERALREHRIEVSRIDKMADGARALAEERKRNGESTTMEKAKKMRSTRKVKESRSEHVATIIRARSCRAVIRVSVAAQRSRTATKQSGWIDRQRTSNRIAPFGRPAEARDWMGKARADALNQGFRSHHFISTRWKKGGGGREAKMLEGKAMIQETDMPVKMQLQAMSCASEALDLFDVLDCKSMAAYIKKEFDLRYGPGWQCVVGSNFGCFFTHKKGTFIYFCLETLYFLIFKGVAA
ncbi:Dynein light chain LC6, flagellar outer [Musa troglodytarum]|uniref:Dynein light chain LC6, flagellar outer n=1 Tax=Musa troglodytarum TaxID=320322 RepID=A0A9E7I6Z8_9LILI|nr:Dynein light chain LC6, flagellar outer [Musa troglodytarum]URE46588.1 Dynein light chain LC6, flagellar outer [Musa troglodytarum]URE46589.1 Dynein light chain LC6, flagellar outer [Musa troglodytarum]